MTGHSVEPGDGIYVVAGITPGEHFVVSDYPVAVTWSDGRPPGFFGPAFGMLNTDVTIPLSSRVALIGQFEEVPETLALDKQGVAS